MPLKLPEIPATHTGPLCLIAFHRAALGMADTLERRMLEDVPLTRNEPGCLTFHIHRDRDDRGLFVVYEIWRDAQALTEHFLKSYAQRFVQEASDYESGDMRVQFLTMSSPYDPGRNAARSPT